MLASSEKAGEAGEVADGRLELGPSELASHISRRWRQYASLRALWSVERPGGKAALRGRALQKLGKALEYATARSRYISRKLWQRIMRTIVTDVEPRSTDGFTVNGVTPTEDMLLFGRC
jgi:hypothetical protein